MLKLIKPMECCASIFFFFSRDVKVGSLCSGSECVHILFLWSSWNIEVTIIPGVIVLVNEGEAICPCTSSINQLYL